MTSLRSSLGSIIFVGTLAVGGVACGSSDSSGSDSSAESVVEWCAKWEEFDAMEENEDDFDALTKQLDTLAKDAPAAISDDMNLLASAFTDSMEAMESMDTEAIEALEEKYNDEAIDGATERIQVYVEDVCGIDVE